MNKTIIGKIKEQLEWRGSNGSKMYNIIISREDALELIGTKAHQQEPAKERNHTVDFDIHALAKKMLDDGYKGEGLDDSDSAYDYILLAADNPDVESELNDKGFAFWRACKFQYRIWLARRSREANHD